MISVLLADDQELVRAGFRLILELAGSTQRSLAHVYDALATARRGFRSTRAASTRLDDAVWTSRGRGTATGSRPRHVEHGARGAFVISLATVKTHVRHVLSKLGLRDRVPAVVLAYESGLVTPGG